MRLFVEKGIQSTPTSLIAKEAGVATGTLFHHFKSKEELVHALYTFIYDSLIEYQYEHGNEEEGIYAQLREKWRLDIEWGTTHTEYFHFLERYSFFHYASESAINEMFERFSHCMNHFEEAAAQKIMCSDDTEYIREHYIWNIRMNISFFIQFPEKCTPQAIENTFNIYWKGIAND